MPEPAAAAAGVLDAPAPRGPLARGPETIAGWALFPSGPTARVEVWVGERSLGLAHLGVARADVAANLGLPGAGIAGFRLDVDLGSWPEPDGLVELRAEATSVSGERLALGPVALELAAAPAPPPAPRPRAVPARRARGRKLLVCTHQLCLGGASRYLVETLAAMLALEAIDPVVLSPIGGPSGEMLEALGIPSTSPGRRRSTISVPTRGGSRSWRPGPSRRASRRPSSTPSHR